MLMCLCPHVANQCGSKYLSCLRGVAHALMRRLYSVYPSKAMNTDIGWFNVADNEGLCSFVPQDGRSTAVLFQGQRSPSEYKELLPETAHGDVI